MRTSRERNDALAVFDAPRGSVDAVTLYGAGRVLSDEVRRVTEELRQKVEVIHGLLAAKNSERNANSETVATLREALANLLQRVDEIHPIRPDGKSKMYWSGAGDQDAAREALEKTKPVSEEET